MVEGREMISTVKTCAQASEAHVAEIKGMMKKDVIERHPQITDLVKAVDKACTAMIRKDNSDSQLQVSFLIADMLGELMQQLEVPDDVRQVHIDRVEALKKVAGKLISASLEPTYKPKRTRKKPPDEGSTQK